MIKRQQQAVTHANRLRATYCKPVQYDFLAKTIVMTLTDSRQVFLGHFVCRNVHSLSGTNRVVARSSDRLQFEMREIVNRGTDTLFEIRIQGWNEMTVICSQIALYSITFNQLISSQIEFLWSLPANGTAFNRATDLIQNWKDRIGLADLRYFSIQAGDHDNGLLLCLSKLCEKAGDDNRYVWLFCLGAEAVIADFTIASCSLRPLEEVESPVLEKLFHGYFDHYDYKRLRNITLIFETNEGKKIILVSRRFYIYESSTNDLPIELDGMNKLVFRVSKTSANNIQNLPAWLWGPKLKNV